MRAIFLALVVLAGASSFAGDRPVRGPETLLGDVAPRALPYNYFRGVSTATNGDQSLALWALDSTLYATTIDRNGNFLRPFPKALLRLPLRNEPGWVYFQRVAWLDGSYAVFVSRGYREPVTLIRVTPELEILEQRVLDVPPFRQLFDTGDELLIAAPEGEYRLRRDFSVIERTQHESYSGSCIVQTPDGPMLAIANAPALTLWPVTGGGFGIRLATVNGPGTVRMVRIGSGYAAAWTECSGACRGRVATFDEGWRMTSGPVDLSFADDVAIFAGGDDTVLVGWTVDGGGSEARWFRGGVPVGAAMFLGVEASLAQLADGRVLAVSRDLETRIVPPPGGDVRRDVPTIATAQSATEERVLAVAASRTQVAIARQRAVYGQVIVSIVDAGGTLVREIPLQASSVALASDGTDFFALYQWSGSWVLRLAGNARPAPLPYPVLPVLYWTGQFFVTVQSEGHRVGDTWVSRTWVRALGRDGIIDDRLCPAVIIPASSDAARIVPAGDDAAWLFLPSYDIPLKRGCPDGPPIANFGLSFPKVAWRAGTWARLQSTQYKPEYVLRLSRDLTSFDGRAHDAGLALGYFGQEAVLTAMPSRWVSGGMSPDGLRVTAFDDSGALTGSTVIADQGRIDAILPMGADRAIVVYSRPVYEAPYSGVWRAIVAPLTFEDISRRRGIAP